jgi:hypothetical protein
MAAGDITPIWNTSVALTSTSLTNLASSTSHLTGWTSAALVNTGLLSRKIAAEITLGTSPAVGEIRMYLVEQLHNVGGTPDYPDSFDGSQGTKTVTSANVRDHICRLVAAQATPATTGAVIPLICPDAAAVFGGTLPQRFIVFITQSTTVNLGGATVWEQGYLEHVE